MACRDLLGPEHAPLDSNASERALRVAALGRKDFLAAGHDDAGENLAGLFSLIGTCEANGVNTVEYLADVLLRVATHPAACIDELLPQRWWHCLATPPEQHLGTCGTLWVRDLLARKQRPRLGTRGNWKRFHPREVCVSRTNVNEAIPLLDKQPVQKTAFGCRG